jgi:hypothetical protein
MTSPQDVRFTKIGAIATVIGVVLTLIGLVIAFLSWRHPVAPSAVAAGTAQSSEPPTSPPPRPTPVEQPPVKISGVTLANEGARGGEPHTALPHREKPTRACDRPETATLHPGSAARVASGLAVLSVKKAHEGSEPYLTLGISSDRDTLAEAVLGAPTRYHFKTSLGTYFVNVSEADLAVGAMTVQVGCEAEGNTP